MKRAALALAACMVFSAPSFAQQNDAPGRSLMEEGTRLFLEGLMSEMEPALRELEGMARDLGPEIRDFARQMGPALRDMLREVEDWSAYEPPEMLPNGDILIRRKTPLEPETGTEPETDPDAVPVPEGEDIEI